MKKAIIIFLVLSLICSVTLFSACSFSGGGKEKVEILEDELVYVNGGTGLRVVLKIKNTSSVAIKTSFNVNVYLNGEVFDSTVSNVLTLGPGETGTLSSISSISRGGDYSYKITKWNYYSA